MQNSNPASQIPSYPEITQKSEVFGGGDLGPVYAEFSIELATAQKIIFLADFVEKNDLAKVEAYDIRTTWFKYDAETLAELSSTGDDEDNDDHPICRTEADRLVVSKDDYWFTCYQKHCDDQSRTNRFSVTDLAQQFGLVYPLPPIPEAPKIE